jgi:hypothetical protein
VNFKNGRKITQMLDFAQANWRLGFLTSLSISYKKEKPFP